MTKHYKTNNIINDHSFVRSKKKKNLPKACQGKAMITAHPVAAVNETFEGVERGAATTETKERERE